MAFIDNPIISALGSELGLGGVFAAAGSPPPGEGAPPPATNPNPAVRPGASKPNIPEYKNRPYIPRNENPGGASRGVQPGGVPSVAPGVMDQDTFQSPEVQKLLGQYGVHPTDTPPDPNLFVHNPEAFVKHPVLAGLLEHGLRGLAYSHPGANFLQSLAGGVRGIQESDAASAQQQNNQLTAPFQQAGMVANLQHQSDEHNSSIALDNYHQAMAKVAGDKVQASLTRAAQVKPMVNQKTGQVMTARPDPDNPDGPLRWQVDESLGQDQQVANKNAFFEHGMNALAALHGGDPSQVTDEERQTLNAHWEASQSEAKSAGARSVAKIPRTTIHFGSEGSVSGKFSDSDKTEVSALNREESDIKKTIRAGTDGFIHDDSGNLLVSGTSKAKAYVQQKQQRLQEIKARRMEIIKAGEGQRTSAPQASPAPVTAAPSGNPFRH